MIFKMFHRQNSPIFRFGTTKKGTNAQIQNGTVPKPKDLITQLLSINLDTGNTVTTTSSNKSQLSGAQKKQMRFWHVVRITCAHLALYAFVVFYILGGAAIFHYLEGDFENLRHQQQNRLVNTLKAEFLDRLKKSYQNAQVQLRYFMEALQSNHISLENYLLFDSLNQATFNHPQQQQKSVATLAVEATKRWTFPSSVLFSFTILTTIGKK